MPAPTPTAKRHLDALTVQELLRELKITRSTFYDWRAKRLAPPCIKLPNGQLRIRRSALDKWLADREENQ